LGVGAQGGELDKRQTAARPLRADESGFTGRHFHRSDVYAADADLERDWAISSGRRAERCNAIKGRCIEPGGAPELPNLTSED
jgi:hypothetical protein